MPQPRPSPIPPSVVLFFCLFGWIYIVNSFSAQLGRWFPIVLFLPVVALLILPSFVYRFLGKLTAFLLRSAHSTLPPRLPPSVKGEHEEEPSYAQGYQAALPPDTPTTDDDLQDHDGELPQASYPHLPQIPNSLQRPPMHIYPDATNKE